MGIRGPLNIEMRSKSRHSGIFRPQGQQCRPIPIRVKYGAEEHVTDLWWCANFTPIGEWVSYG